MDRILKIGMDVHSTNYTLCAVESRFGKEDHVLANISVGPDYKLIVDFINKIKLRMDPQSKDGLFATYTLHELLDELDVIECFMEPGKAPIQGEVLKKQEQIYRDLDVTPLLAAGQPADA